MQLNPSLENSSFNRGRSQSPESHRNITSISPAVDIDAEKNSPFYGTTESFAPLATSSSLDEQVVIKEQFCTDNIKLATPRTETSSTYGGNKKEKMTQFVCPFKCHDKPKTLASLKYHIQLQHSEESLLEKFQEVMKILLHLCCAHVNVVLSPLKHKMTKGSI